MECIYLFQYSLCELGGNVKGCIRGVCTAKIGDINQSRLFLFADNKKREGFLPSRFFRRIESVDFWNSSTLAFPIAIIIESYSMHIIHLFSKCLKIVLPH